jgi:hypothetical protein
MYPLIRFDFFNRLVIRLILSPNVPFGLFKEFIEECDELLEFYQKDVVGTFHPETG